MGVELPAQHQTLVPDIDTHDNLSDSELVSQLKNALKLSTQGDFDSYNEIVGVLHHDRRLGPEKIAMLVTCLKALSGAVSCIHIIHHQSLLNAIYGMSLWNYGTDVMDALVELLLSLAASSGQQVDLCLDMLVNNFVPPRDFMRILKEQQPRGLARKTQVLDRVHETLKNIAALVPLSPMRLEKIVRDRMPHSHSNLDPEVMVMYVENMLRLENGPLGELVGGTMLVAIVDSLIDLDVEIAWDDNLEDDFTKGIFDMELGEFEGVGDDAESAEMRESWIQKLFGGAKFAMKLDTLLVLTFEHLKLCHESGRLPQVFEILLQSFETTVLTAYKSKFAQFVMFYACSLDPENCGKRFATMLQYIFMNSMYPQWRMSAVAYLASYLSRAKFVSASFVATMLESLAKWCSEYCKNQDGEINPKVHKVFYSGCQAIMYVLCFRMRSMVLIPRLRVQLRLLNIEEILRHPLSPLKVCLPSIVEEFLHIVREAELFTVPETQEPNGLLESDLSMAFGGVERLDMFFPFDPCLLSKSDSFIRPNFVYWKMVKISPDDDDEEEGGSDDDIAEACGYEGIDMVNGSVAHHLDDEFDHSFDKMSITPKESLLHNFAARNLRMQMPSKIRPSMSPESL